MKKIIILCLFSVVWFACDNQKTIQEQKESSQPKDPISILNDSIQMDSTNSMLYVRRAALYLQNEKISQSLQDVTKAITLDNNNVDAYLLLSDIYYGMGNFDNVSVTLNKATEINPYDARPYVKLAEINLLMKKFQIAIGFTDKALEISKFNPQAYYVKGMVFLANADTVSAMKNLLIARDQDNNFIEPLYQIGIIYTAQKNPLAEAFLKDALKRFSYSNQLRYQLALFLQDNGKPDEAIQQYDTLLMSNPDNSRLLFNIGYVNFVYKYELDSALKYFNQVLELDPDYVDALYNKGRVYEEMKNFSNARDIYKEILNKRPNYQLAVDGINRVERLR